MNSTARERDRSHTTTTTVTTDGRSACSTMNLLHALSDDSEIDCLEENIVFLRPYVCILGLIGLRPNAVDVDLCTLLGHLQSIMVLMLLLAGYVLQYLSGFRRDRGFSTLDPPPTATGMNFDELPQQLSTTTISTTSGPAVVTTSIPGGLGFATVTTAAGSIMKTIMLNTSEMIFIYIIPTLLHLGGFVIAIYIYRFADNEHLQCLIEKVFILCNIPRRLVVTLWVYFILGALWLAGSTAYIYLLTLKHSYVIARLPSRWSSWDELDPTDRDYVRIFLCVALFFHDLVQVVIIISYSLMCYLLRCYLVGLKEKLLLHTIEPLNWMREICEFRKLLHHLNAKISLPVACLALLNLSYTFSSVAHLFQDMNSCPIRVFSYTVANVLLWLVISLTPFFQAASLTAYCRETQTCGHLISIRPFVHRNTSSEDLNTVLLYASSLNMSAKLFRMPINAHYLCFVVFVCIVALLTFGMCLSLAIDGGGD
ncbi:uncharacterized protein LOC109414804 isoform X2 [Aedes albopictus]|uniref:Uncharacterized protein n=1 Tax=Aedes albopictus TaxID=7160 RepID=A0ABM1YWP5_AEDAL